MDPLLIYFEKLIFYPWPMSAVNNKCTVNRPVKKKILIFYIIRQYLFAAPFLFHYHEIFIIGVR